MMNMQLFLTVAFLFCGVRVAEGAMSATVESGEEHCYNVIAPKGVKSTISGNFDILDDNAPPDPIGVVLYDSNMVSFKLTTPFISQFGSIFVCTNYQFTFSCHTSNPYYYDNLLMIK
jgi:predicted secreted protein